VELELIQAHMTQKPILRVEFFLLFVGGVPQVVGSLFIWHESRKTSSNERSH
jgi:hypothetical protein